jgi:hypothetical protein
MPKINWSIEHRGRERGKFKENSGQLIPINPINALFLTVMSEPKRKSKEFSEEKGGSG